VVLYRVVWPRHVLGVSSSSELVAFGVVTVGVRFVDEATGTVFFGVVAVAKAAAAVAEAAAAVGETSLGSSSVLHTSSVKFSLTSSRRVRWL